MDARLLDILCKILHVQCSFKTATSSVHIEYKAVSNSYTYCFDVVVVIILEKSFTCFLESSYSSIISAHLFRRQNFAILEYKREICLNQLFSNYFSKPVQATKLRHSEVQARDFLFKIVKFETLQTVKCGRELITEMIFFL